MRNKRFPWEAYCHLPGQEVLCLVWNLKIHTVFHFNIIFPSTPRSPKWSHPFRFSCRYSVCNYHLPVHGTSAIHIIVLDFIILLMFGEKCTLWSLLLCNFLHHLLSLFLGSDILFRSFFSNTFNLCSFLWVKHKFHTQIKTTDTVIIDVDL